jgi:DNA-binding SARP family transcriptional activator
MTELNRWYEWIDASARKTGDKSLVAAVPLLEAIACLRWGSFHEAAEKVEIALSLASEIDESCLVAHALAVLVDVNVASGSYASCFEAAAQLFAMSPATGSTAKGRAFVGLALLELQGDRPIASLNWLRALGEEAAATKSADGPDAVSSVAGLGALDAATAIILSGASFDAGAGILSESLLEEFQNAAVELDSSLDLDRPDELLAATATLHSAAAEMQGAPFLQAKVWLCLGGLLARGARHEQARRLFDDARTQFGAIEAAGWVSLCDREIKLLSKPSGDRLSFVPTYPDEHRAADPREEASSEFVWEIRMLGAFSIQSEGKKVTLPLSLSAQTLKIVALRESIPVDELVEHLWPEAEPGVGSRRLRNVLWRLRSTCGELITRQDNLICLAPETVTDVGIFRRKAEQALDPHTSMDQVLVLARDALRVYAGDLLPGDRYADWAEIPRESLQRLHIRLLEVLIDDAELNDRTAEALSLTEQMIDDDPYNEEHYLRAATFHANSGSPRTAVAMLVRAERMLSELGVSPSASLEKMRQSLGDL